MLLWLLLVKTLTKLMWQLWLAHHQFVRGPLKRITGGLWVKSALNRPACLLKSLSPLAAYAKRESRHNNISGGFGKADNHNKGQKG